MHSKQLDMPPPIDAREARVPDTVKKMPQRPPDSAITAGIPILDCSEASRGKWMPKATGTPAAPIIMRACRSPLSWKVCLVEQNEGLQLYVNVDDETEHLGRSARVRGGGRAEGSRQ
jgi:hypothetical protein